MCSLQKTTCRNVLYVCTSHLPNSVTCYCSFGTNEQSQRLSVVCFGHVWFVMVTCGLLWSRAIHKSEHLYAPRMDISMPHASWRDLDTLWVYWVPFLFPFYHLLKVCPYSLLKRLHSASKNKIDTTVKLLISAWAATNFKRALDPAAIGARRLLEVYN